MSTREPNLTEGPRPNRLARSLWIGVGLLALAALAAWRVHIRRQLLEGAEQQSAAVQFELHAPRGRVAEFGEFTWEAVAPPLGGYRVRVFDAVDGRVPLLEGHVLGEPSWRPTEAIVADDIRWVVEVFDGNGRLVGAAEAEAWSSPPR